MIKVENATQIRPHMKANELKKLTFVRPFHLVGLFVHDRPHNTRDKANRRLKLSSRDASDALLS